MLMAICHPFLVFLMAFGRVVPCCCYTMLWSPRYWWSTFTAIPTFLVSVWSLSGLCLLLYGAVPLSPISQYADDTSLILTSDDGSFSVSHDGLAGVCGCDLLLATINHGNDPLTTPLTEGMLQHHFSAFWLDQQESALL